MCTAYVLPLASRSNRPVGQQFKCSLALVAAYPVPAFAAFALAAIPVAIAIWVPGGLFFVGFFWGLLFTGGMDQGLPVRETRIGFVLVALWWLLFSLPAIRRLRQLANAGW